MHELPDLDDCRAAARTLAGRVHTTPVFSSRRLGERIGREASLKAELFQRTGSFKLRGAINRVAAMGRDERAAGVVTASAGNHAQAAALACAEAGLDVVVFMPSGASATKVAATREYGATVDLESRDGAEALARMASFARESGRVVLHPFDDARVIAGQGTVGLEIADQVPVPAAVLVPASGGGLLSGVAIAVKALVPTCRIVAVQPERSATLRAGLGAVAAGADQARGTTIADALTAPVMGRLCLRACEAHVDEVVHLSEDEIAAGMRFVYGAAKLACEAGAALGVAALLAGRVSELPPSGTVVAVISGGNIAPAAAAAILAGAA
jgi:threonine dehydratase